MRRFLIYADGGQIIGMGHAMRVKTFAVALRQVGIEPYFVTSSEEIMSYLAEGNYDVRLINALDYRVLGEIFDEIGAEGILVDKFNFKLTEHEYIAKKTGLLVQIDDFSYDGPAQIIINCSIDVPPSNKGIWLCGGKHALIRENFIETNKEIKKDISDVLITTGYLDPSNMHLKFIDILSKLHPESRIHVIVGGGYTTIETLMQRKEKNKNIILYKDCKDISSIMKKCDLAISAAGTTLYELAAAGVPTIAIALYDNQVDNIRRVFSKGCIESLGWYEDVDEEKICSSINSIYNDFQRREELSKRGRMWIDGKGAHRCAEIILEYMDTVRKTR